MVQASIMNYQAIYKTNLVVSQKKWPRWTGKEEGISIIVDPSWHQAVHESFWLFLNEVFSTNVMVE